MSNTTIVLTLSAALLITSAAACSGERAAAEPNSPVNGAAASAQPASTDAAPQDAAQAPSGAAPGTTAAPPAAPVSVDPAAAVVKVNGVAITEKEVQEGVRAFLQGQGAPASIPPQQMQQVREAVLDALIGSELVFQRSKSAGITAPPEEIEKALVEVKKQYSNETAFVEDLKTRGTDEAAFRALIGRNIVIDRTVKKEVLDKIVISEETVKAYYDAHPQEMQKPEEVRASHILFRLEPGAAPEVKAAAKKKADDLLVKVKAGEDFAALAKQHSEDPGSGPNGGDLNFFRRGAMVEPFDSTAFGMKVGQISDVIESQFGYHIIKVTDRHDGGLASLAEISGNLREFLKQRESREKVQALLQSLRDAAKVEIL